MSTDEAQLKAESQVSTPYKVGRVWKFSRQNDFGQWEESPAVKTEEEAEQMRKAAIIKRAKEYTGIVIALDD